VNVVSTSPSATEILYAIGVEPVAVSHACDYPPEVENKPAIDSSRISGETSGERHAQTAAAAADGDVYSMHAERLRAADPDLIITWKTGAKPRRSRRGYAPSAWLTSGRRCIDEYSIPPIKGPLFVP
jgi:ABC-type Fe3+-hydroxamate transport system substrate-binding protein